MFKKRYRNVTDGEQGREATRAKPHTHTTGKWAGGSDDQEQGTAQAGRGDREERVRRPSNAAEW